MNIQTPINRKVVLLASIPLLLAAFPVNSGTALPPKRTPESAITPGLQQDRHRRMLERIEQGPIGLLFLGDSITDFWPDRSPETWAKFAPYHPADFGVSGDRTENVLWRLTNGELEGINPKAVVILIGTNNIGHWMEEKPEWAAAGVKKIIETVQHKLPNAEILLLAVFPRDKQASDMRKRVTTINNIIKGYADDNKVHYLDLTDKFLDPAGEIPADIMPDGLHPTDKGYQIWYAAMWPTLEPLLK